MGMRRVFSTYMSQTATFTLESLIKTELPPLPGSVMKVYALLQDYNASHREIANAISLDPALASRILRRANSPIYALERTVTNLSSAVTTVGNEAIYESLMIGLVGDTFGREIQNSVVGRDAWFHSLAVAMTASDLCRLVNLRGTDEAFSCGLLHDIGKLIFLRADSAYYIKVLELGKDEGDLVAVEKETFGFDHAALGALAAENWNLPPQVCDMIRYHHEPANSRDAVAITTIINIADTLAYRKNENLDIYELVASNEAARFNLTVEQLDKIWDTVVERLRDVVRNFF